MRSIISLSILFVLILILPAGSFQAKEPDRPVTDGERDNLGILVYDGSGVHDIGELLLHTGNWGVFGSYPGSSLPIVEFPSAEWPAGSGVEHLYISGIWIGAIKGGLPVVSTSAFDREFMPTDEAIDIIYNSFEGAPGGIRLPSPGADDDGDGMMDEDWLDGHDNDGDGMIDEDFAAISPQMFSSWFADNTPGITDIYPEHEPLDVMVRQESFQWSDPRFDDFVGITFSVTNIGLDALDHFHFGFFMDGDIGRHDEGQYCTDDAAGSWQGFRCTELGPVHVSMGYMYDADGDGGLTTSYFGAMILGHLIDSTGQSAPDRVGMTSFKIFTGGQPYENGGDPQYDFERFEAMSSASIDRDRADPGDYRILISTGGFSLFPGQTLVFHVGLVAGDGLEGLLENAAMCQRLFDGMWFDYDGLPTTGVDGRETPLPGPIAGIDPDPCDDDDSLFGAARGEILWINADCSLEDEFKEYCGYDESDRALFRTGVEGRETHVNWISEWSPPVSTGTLDIKPGTCKNPFNIKNFEFLMSGNPNKGGVMPVAILGAEGFDVTEIDISTVRLNGVAPLDKGQSYGDVAGPGESEGPCHCGEEGPDGYTDLLLKFSNQEIAATRIILSIPEPGEVWTLAMTGELNDGTAFTMSDCVTLVGPPPDFDRPDRPYLLTGETRLLSASPNPFNPATTIAFELAAPGDVSITVYDVRGRLIRSLVNGHLTAGMHEVTWNGRDRSGASAASGVYFYRLVAGEILETKKMVLLR